MKSSIQRTILIVDDIPGDLNALMIFLENAGFRISVAQTGKTALQRAEQTTPDIILLDVLMPVMDGFETCRRLKEQESTREIPVIFMTGVAETVEKVKGFEAGGVDYLTKPVQHEEMLARINAHLTIRTLQQQLQQEHDRFQRLSEATFEGILIHDDRTILDANQVIAALCGYQRAELIGRSPFDLITPEDREMVTVQMQREDEHPYETHALTQNGVTLPIEMQAKQMTWHGQRLRVAAIRDIRWKKALEEEKDLLQRENITLRSTIRDRYKFGAIIGKSPVMQDVYQSIVNAAASEANVVISGESGTGKELAAQTIHQLSERKDQPFVAVNCGAVPENLFEREFFGHRKGAFTGATRDQPGYFDRAHSGTLFLDEVGELAPQLQVKLLRALQEKEYIPLGDTVSRKVDVRVIAATNQDLKSLLQQGAIRQDFFYRIRVIAITLPPLRDRREDIPLLVAHFLEQYRSSAESQSLPARIMDALCAYRWPGNVRELQNELQRYLAQHRLEFLETLDALVIENEVMTDMSTGENCSLSNAMEQFEKHFLLEIFERHHRNRKDTAAALGIDRKTLYTKLKKYEVI